MSDSGAFPPHAHDPTSHDWNSNNHQIVLVLVGLVGSGKSAFAKALEKHIPVFRRCNQDDLGNRKRVEALARHSLEQDLSVCIDRTNFDEAQRAHWIKIANEFPGTRAWCIIFDTPLNICEDRLKTRTGHPTIDTPELGIQVLHRFNRDYRAPTANEGFGRIYTLRCTDQREVYTKDELASILNRVASSVPAASALYQREPSEDFQTATGPPRGNSNEYVMNC